MSREEIQSIMKPENFIGMAPLQTQEYITNEVKPMLDKNSGFLGIKGNVKV